MPDGPHVMAESLSPHIPEPTPQAEPGLEELKLAHAFVAQWIVFTKHSRSYPADHPLVAAAAGRALQFLRPLLARCGELTVGVTPQALYVGKSFLDRYNRQFQAFAALLNEHGVATVTFAAAAGAEDLARFVRLLELQPPEVWNGGGPEEVLRRAGVAAISVRRVSSDYFQLREDSAEQEEEGRSLWESLMEFLGEENLLPENGWSREDAALLARLLTTLSEGSEGTEERLTAAQGRFLDAMAPQLRVYTRRSLEQIVLFVEGLGPRLRKLFLLNLFGATPPRGEFTEGLVSRLPAEAVLDALRTAAASPAYVPPLVHRLMAKLAAIPGAEAEEPPLDDPQRDLRMRLLFRPDQLEKFVPASYLETLQSLVGGSDLPPATREAMEELKSTLDGITMEQSLMGVLFEVMGEVPAEAAAGIAETLQELCDLLLETGDFPALERVFRQLRERASSPRGSLVVTRMMEYFFGSSSFSRSLLESLSSSEKQKRDEITSLIRTMGPLLIPALLDRLAEEQNMSLRRYYMQRLAEFGRPSCDAAIERLGDRRWFFVRNLVILLRGMKDRRALPHIRPLASHEHPRVREEALKTILFFGDSSAEQVLLRELASGDRGRILNAVRLCEATRSAEVMEKLLEILATTPFAAYDAELKSAAVKGLAAMALPAALPHLERFLATSHFLRPVLHAAVKAEVVQSLTRYPREQARPLLERLARGRGAAAKEAAALLFRIPGGKR